MCRWCLVVSELALRAGVQSVSGTRLSFLGRPEGCHCITGGPCTESHRQGNRTKVHALFEIGTWVMAALSVAIASVTPSWFPRTSDMYTTIRSEPWRIHVYMIVCGHSRRYIPAHIQSWWGSGPRDVMQLIRTQTCQRDQQHPMVSVERRKHMVGKDFNSITRS